MDVRSVRFGLAAVVAAVVLAAGLLLGAALRADRPGHEPYRGPLASPGTPATKPGSTRRIALNTEPADYPRLRALGYDLVDIGPEASQVAGVPPGMQAPWDASGPMSTRS